MHNYHGRIWEWLLNTIAKINQWGKDIWTKATTAVSKMVDSVVNWFKQLPGKIWTWLLQTIQNVVNWVFQMKQKAEQGVRDVVNSIINFFKELPQKMLDIGKNIVDGLWNGIKNAWNGLKEGVSNLGRGLADGLKNTLGIHSPSRVFRDEIGRFIPQGLAVGVEADTEEALKAIRNMDDKIMNEMNKAVAIETGSINANATVKSNNNIMNTINANLRMGVQSIDNNKEIVVNAVTNLDGKVLTSTVNRVNAKQKLQYGIA